MAELSQNTVPVQNVEIIRRARHAPVNQSRPLEFFQISEPTGKPGCGGR
jgi:hypothetical protein